ncbi:hypothetical protein Asd1617_03063 [Shigella dysenteriae 1617]|uniref:Uncharacterized protein n=1 Tax=Shigella dysenteriae 1617 TaxID=754093 RepID=A0A0A6ZVH6_SHIDY|nr:hypothetical protein Asd1617_03063 [Shigella dysenteriae 1617]
MKNTCSTNWKHHQPTNTCSTNWKHHPEFGREVPKDKHLTGK